MVTFNVVFIIYNTKCLKPIIQHLNKFYFIFTLHTYRFVNAVVIVHETSPYLLDFFQRVINFFIEYGTTSKYGDNLNLKYIKIKAIINKLHDNKHEKYGSDGNSVSASPDIPSPRTITPNTQ